jgi:hypothetical protein
MKFPLGLLVLVALSGCEPPKPAPTTTVLEAAPTQPLVSIENAAGVWSTQDENGQPFDLVLFENGQALSTWVKGSSGARGERGFWRETGREVLVFFDDGWTDRLGLKDGQPRHEGFAPGISLTSPATNSASAEKVSDDRATFVGVWRLNREPDGSYLYITLQANGTAFSTINGITEGRWELVEGAAKVTWPDGWVDVIERAEGSWQKRSWVGGDAGTPADLTQATRVGEIKFGITP